MKTVVFLFILLLTPPLFATNENTADSALSSSTNETEVNTRPWWIGDLLTVLSILVGVGLIIFQLNRQHKNDIETQKENNRDQLRLEIYQEFSKCLDNANNKTMKAGMFAFMLTSNVSNYLNQINLGINTPPLKYRANEFSDLHYLSNNSIINLIKLIEKYEIVSPELEIFKIALNVAAHDIDKAFSPLFQFLIRMLPMDINDGHENHQIANVIIPTQDQMDELQRLVDEYKDKHDDLGGYLYDLNLELQKLFLSYLFSNKLKIRDPIDPNIKVITTDPIKMTELKRYFEEESPWGIQKNETEERVRNEHENS